MKKDNIQSIAKNVVEFEINALKKLKKNINSNFSKVVRLILNCKNGKIIISGVGKSGIIARKWAATFSSTGTPSFFLDAANASHGDLGQVTSNDVVILISNSGESDELKNIIQYTSRNKNISLIGITSHRNSLLYKNSDVGFLIPNIKSQSRKYCSYFFNIRSISIRWCNSNKLYEGKNFTKFDFKKIHSGGNLSVRLKTVDLMIIGNKIPFVRENMNMKKALDVINNKTRSSHN